jgi:hypothetical protein
MASDGGTAGLVATGVSGLGRAYSSYIAARGQKMNLEFAASQAAFQQQLDEMQARDAAARGADRSFKMGLDIAQRLGKQRARFAARGGDIRSGSAANILRDTRWLGARDMATLADNTQKEVWAIQQGAMARAYDARTLLANARSVSPGGEALAGLISGAGEFHTRWRRLNPTASTTSTTSTTAPTRAYQDITEGGEDF